MNNLPPKVSVCIITYNHENYIAQALEGALKQKCDFSFEIVIGEDCSSDNTLAICKKFTQQNPDKIRLLHREKNLGMMNNFVATLKACQGEYIALLEGDDYWTDEFKLACQVEFLERHKDFSICSHNVNIAYEDQVSDDQWLGQDAQTERNLEDLLNGSGGATCSLVFRVDALTPIPDWYPKQKGGDWSLQILCASKGKMHYFSDVMGVYRRHAKGAVYYQRLDAQKRGEDQIAVPSKNSLEICDAIDRHFEYRYSHIINYQRAYWYWIGAIEYVPFKRIKAWEYALKALRMIPRENWQGLPNFSRTLSMVFLGNMPNKLRGMANYPSRLTRAAKRQFR